MEGYPKKYLPLLLGLAVAVGIGVGSLLNYSGGRSMLSKGNPKKEKLNRLIDYIDYEYVDNVNTDSIVDVTINGILQDLDPHSVYIPPSDMEEVAENMKGDFVGIGVSFYIERDTIVVIQPIAGGPSDLAGVKAGDRIIAADGISLAGKKLSQDSIAERLKGKIDTQVALKVKRPGTKAEMNFDIARATVPIKSLDAAYMLTSTLGYVKLNRFAETTPSEFEHALQKLKADGATQIVLDLRDNPGGYVTAAEKVADEFLEDNKLILFTKNKTGKIEKTFATGNGLFEHSKVFVLINENSASASEIVSGALQDNDKAIIIGRRSFGKGLVQREMGLGDGSAVRLTVARYYTPTGRSIQRPYDDGTKAYYEDYLNRYKHGEMRSQDSIKVADSLRFVTPGGKVVYGGGGIIPDVFIPKETDYEHQSIDYALRSGLLPRFAFDLLEKKRAYYNSLTLNDFTEKVQITDADLKDFVSYAARQNLKIRPTDYRPLLKNRIKAVMAQQLFGTTIYEKLINDDSPMIKKVIQLSKK